jgi:hypothetical protein
VPFPNPIPRLGVKINVLHMDADTLATPFLDGAPDNRRQYTVFDLGPTRLSSILAARSYLNHRTLRSISNVIAPQARLECCKPRRPTGSHHAPKWHWSPVSSQARRIRGSFISSDWSFGSLAERSQYRRRAACGCARRVDGLPR